MYFDIFYYYCIFIALLVAPTACVVTQLSSFIYTARLDASAELWRILVALAGAFTSTCISIVRTAQALLSITKVCISATRKLSLSRSINLHTYIRFKTKRQERLVYSTTTRMIINDNLIKFAIMYLKYFWRHAAMQSSAVSAAWSDTISNKILISRACLSWKQPTRSPLSPGTVGGDH